MFSRKKMLWTMMLLVVLSSGLFFFQPKGHLGTDSRDLPPWIFNSLEDSADLKMEDIEFVSNFDGRDRWILHAGTARYFKADGRVYVDRIEARLLLDSGQAVNITADHGSYAPQSRNVTLWGRVCAVSSDQARFYTKTVTYDDKALCLRTDEDVTIVSPKFDVEGKGLTYDLATGKMAIMKNVRVITREAVN